MRRFLVAGLALLLVVTGVVAVRLLIPQAVDAASPCSFTKAAQPAAVAFCETFDKAAAPNSSRSGVLDPTVWGVSRIQYADQGGADLWPQGANADTQIVNGELQDTVTDGGGQTVLAMYPRQPFDVAGREGDVTFDLSNDTEGPHSAWPSFVYTDQPVPAPYDAASGIVSSPQNSFGISFDYDYGSGDYLPNGGSNGCHTVGSVWETVKGKVEGPFTPSGVNPTVSTPFGTWQDLNCIGNSSSPTALSHIEIQIGDTGVFVWGSNPGSTDLVELASCQGCTLPLTRGLVWMEDTHYNADKFNDEATNTFGWDNFGFDGPILPRDLALEVGNSGNTSLGYADGSTVTTSPATAQELSAVTGTTALVEMNFFNTSESAPSVSVNGHAAIAGAWDFDTQSLVAGYGPTYVWNTIAIPVPVSDLVAGANTIHVTGAGQGFANVDIILPGAGGVPTCLDPSNCSTPVSSGPGTSTGPSPTPTTTPPAVSPTPTPVTTAAPTPVASTTPAPISPTPTPTATPAPRRHLGGRGHRCAWWSIAAILGCPTWHGPPWR